MLAPRRLVAFAACALGLILASAPGVAATTVSLSSDKPSIAYGQWFRLTVHVVTEVATCPGSTGPQGQVTLEHDGVAVPASYGWYPDVSPSCVNGVLTTNFVTNDYDLAFGGHLISVTYLPPGAAGPSVRSNALSVIVNPQATVVTAAGVVAAGIMNPRPGWSMSWYCTAPSIQVQVMPPVAPPADGAWAQGVVAYQASGCNFDCGFLCPGGIPTQPQQRVLVKMPRPIPAGAKFWFYSTGPGMGAGWQRIDAQVQGSYAMLLVSGGPGQHALSGFIAMTVDAPVPDVQDMWWAGPAENGWGLSIAQNGGKLFVGLYVYREDGSPEWLVLPLGSWDAQGHYTGMLYEPKGSWFGQYDASRFDAGNPVGEATLTFSSDSTGTVDYTIRGVSGHKSITRLPFGSMATPPVQGAHAGLWWAGSARTGWGLAIGHQGDTLFSVWYTYAKDGSTAWYVMPGGTWMSSDTYSGTLYRTTGKSWLSGAYDPTALKVTPVGTMTLHFTGPATATMTYSVDGTSGTESIAVQPF